MRNFNGLKNYKFGIYTSFYNAEKFIDEIFDSVSKIKYDNFEWIITDDFSSDNTKQLLIEKCKKYNFVKYVEQNQKKEMYWKPNNFFDDSFDYIVLIDCDDAFDFDFLKIYNYFANAYPEAVVITSDFIKTENDKLHSLSLVKNDRNLIDKLAYFSPQTDYLYNFSYNALGHLRCFKNLKSISFEIEDFDACAEDSYRMMILNSLGKWIHIPRVLYQWKIRHDSESHSTAKSNFNGNFNIAYEKLKHFCFDPYYDFDDLFKFCNGLSILGINDLHNKTISVFSNHLNQEKQNKLRAIYFDCKINFNDSVKSDYYLFLAKDFGKYSFIKNKIIDIKRNDPLSKIIIYYFEDSFFEDKNELSQAVNNSFDQLKNQIEGFGYSYFSYFRHLFIIL